MTIRLRNDVTGPPLTAILYSPSGYRCFFDDFNRYRGTKVGGYPMEIQHGAGIQDFVFQVGSEKKVNWMWADNGIGYFHKSPERVWIFSCRSTTSDLCSKPKLTRANVA